MRANQFGVTQLKPLESYGAGRRWWFEILMLGHKELINHQHTWLFIKANDAKGVGSNRSHLSKPKSQQSRNSYAKRGGYM